MSSFVAKSWQEQVTFRWQENDLCRKWDNLKLDSQWKTVVHDGVFSVVLCPLRRWNCEYITAVTYGAELKLVKYHSGESEFTSAF